MINVLDIEKQHKGKNGVQLSVCGGVCVRWCVCLCVCVVGISANLCPLNIHMSDLKQGSHPSGVLISCQG